MPKQQEIKVLKFGGTSVKSPQRLLHVARIIAAESKYKCLVVVSAMGHTTDNLVQLAARCSDAPNPRELDVLLASGEQQTIALLSIVLSDLGIKTRSFTGPQLGIITEANYGGAEILSIDCEKIRRAFETFDVIVVAGFQGVTIDGDITTLGRGGSDTSAVALAAAVGTKLCEIYTDVDGIFTADPNIIGDAKQHGEISYDDCLDMAAQGAQVIHPRAVECARENKIPLIVRSVFNPENNGTLICDLAKPRQERIVGITAVNGFALLEVTTSADQPEAARLDNFIRTAVGEVNLHNIARKESDKTTASYLISGLNEATAEKLVNTALGLSGVETASVKLNITRLSIVGDWSKTLDAASLPSTIRTKLAINRLLPSRKTNCVSLFVEQDKSVSAWKELHEHFLERFSLFSNSEPKPLCKAS